MTQPVFGQIDITSNNAVNSIDNYNADYAAQSKSIWSEAAGDLSSAGGYVWDEAKGAWVSAKDVVASVATGATDYLSGLIDSIKENILIGIGILLVVIWVIAKSGILSQLNLTMVV